MRTHFLHITTISILSLLMFACGKSAAPDVVAFKQAALYPEGVEYDPVSKHFLVTSLREGSVGKVSDDGSYQPFIQNDNMVSAIGLRIDHAGDRVLVCNSDPGASKHTKKETQGKLAGLGVYKLSSGELIKYIDLGKLASASGGHFCNDIALDKAGNAYVSDSFSPIIYKVDTDYKASIFFHNPRFIGEGFNLNGLVVKDDYLLVAKYNEGILFKLPLQAPENFSQVKIATTMPGADGLLWAPDGSLMVIANMNTNKVFTLNSSDDWATAKIVNSKDTGEVFATTGVVRDGSTYVLHAMLHVLFNPETKTHIETFEIRKQ